MTKICLVCQKEFQIKNYRKETARFCSAKFRIVGLFKQTEKLCLVCGKSFYVKRNRIDSAKYCSKRCMGLGFGHPPKSFVCKNCGITFIRYENRNPNRNNTDEFCSVRCYREQFGNVSRKRKSGYRTSIEKIVEQFLIEKHVEYEFEYPFGPYSIDFAITKDRIAIECDGKYWHSLPKTVEIDIKRASYLSLRNWIVVRLSEDSIKDGSFTEQLSRFIP